MVKHFETVWEDSEQLSLTSDSILTNSECENLLYSLIKDLSSSSNKTRTFGYILYYLSWLSARLNINTYEALVIANQEKSSNILEPD